MLLAVAAGLGWALSGSRPSSVPRAKGPIPSRWVSYRHVGDAVDLAVPPKAAGLIFAASGHLQTIGALGVVTAFAPQVGRYTTNPESEAYIALVPGGRMPGAKCSFPPDSVFALHPLPPTGVLKVTRSGRVRWFARVPSAILSGIAFDDVGRFGHRLLVTSTKDGRSSLYTIDCAGHVTTLSTHMPRVEGGMTVAPRSFGKFGGDLIASDEVTGSIWAFTPSGRAHLVAQSGLPAGEDAGLESTGFVPPGFGQGWAAFISDRALPEDVGQAPQLAVLREPSCGTAMLTNPCEHAGSGGILRLPAAVLLRAGARPGDLVVATEARARTILVHCARTCRIRRIAYGPDVTNAEGHIVFTRLG